MTPKPIKIRIGGKTVLCRKLKRGEMINPTDVCIALSNQGYITCYWHGVKFSENQAQVFRPIPRAKKRKAKSLKAYIDKDFFDSSMCPGEGFWRVTSFRRSKPTDVECTITLSAKGAKK